jgi:hypothetical protein
LSVNFTNVCYWACEQLGAVDPGQTQPSQLIADALVQMNNWIDNASQEGIWIPIDVLTTWSMTAGQQSYTIGSAQTINLARPVRIVAAAFTNSSGPGGELKVVTEKEWASVPDRQSQSAIPKVLFWDRGNPTGNVYIGPVPLYSTLSGQIHTFQPLSQFVDATTAYTFFPGYEQVYVLALAKSIATWFSPSQQRLETILANYAEVAERIRMSNALLIGDPLPESQGGK